MKKKKLFIAFSILNLTISLASLVGLAYFLNTDSIEDKIYMNATSIEEDDDVDVDTLTILEKESYKVNVGFIYQDDFKCDHQTITTEKESLNHRNEGKRYFTEINALRDEEIRLKNYSSKFVSSYGPFIIYEYEDLDSFMDEDYSNLLLSDNEELETVVIENKPVYVNTASRNTTTGSVYRFSNALEDIGIPTSKTYTGSGVKIGSIESGIYDNAVNLNGIEVTTTGTTTASHATYTYSIYGGTSGIANGAAIHFFALSDYSYSLNTAFEDMISNGVHVINMSASVYFVGGSQCQGYTRHTYYADYYVNQYNITHINSAGNYDTDGVVNGSATGLNVVGVASNDADRKISYFSSVGVGSAYTSYLASPTVTAPGGYIYGISNINYYLSGTSFSAPMVTGIVALLMEEFPELKYNSAAVKSILSCSTTYIEGQTDIWDEDAGFGLVNYQRAREAAKNYYSATFSTIEEAGYEIYQTTVNIPLGSTFYYNSVVSYLASMFGTSAYGQMKIDATLTNTKGETIDISSYNNSNLNSIAYTNNSNDETFTLTIKLAEDKTNAYAETYAYSYHVTNELSYNGSITSTSAIQSNDLGQRLTWDISSISLKEEIYPHQDYELAILDGDNNLVKTLSDVDLSGTYIMRQEEWEKITSASNSVYKVLLGYINNDGTIADIYSEPAEFNVPTSSSLEQSTLEVEDYYIRNSSRITTSCFEVSNAHLDAYYVGVSQTDSNFINLSGMTQSDGVGYIEYHSDTTLYRADFDISLFSSSESITSSNTTAVVQYLDSSKEWVTSLDLLNDISLNTSYSNLESKAAYFPEGTTTFRIYLSSTLTNQTDQGRFSIGDVVIYV